MMRIVLFLATNLAVLLVASITLRLFGVESYLNSQGSNFTSLLIFCFVFGMAGSLVSLFISKWMAKRSTGTVVIETPSNATEQWLVTPWPSFPAKRALRRRKWAFSPPSSPTLCHRLE